jgi:exopolysaccharide biosynthesis polyprenyl glycosylphosphotransferase
MKLNHRAYALLMATTDVVVLALALNVIAMVRGVTPWGTWLWGPLILPCLLWLIVMALIDAYRIRSDKLSLEFASEMLIAVLIVVLLTLLGTYAIVPANWSLAESRITLVLALTLTGVVTLWVRRIWQLGQPAPTSRHFVYLGTQEEAEAFARECRLKGLGGTVHAAQVDDAKLPATRDLLAAVTQGQLATEAIVLRESIGQLPDDLWQKMQQLFFDGTPTYTLERFHEVYWRKIPLYRINGIWLFQQGFAAAREPLFDRIKRISDVAMALLGLVATAPLLLLAAGAVFAEDRGPVFFRQERIGRHRRPFQIWKLRTMKTGLAGDRYTAQADPRITRVGQWLRTTRLDEIPQLWNVLKGEMSLIGPRAEWVALVADYEKAIPCYHFRHLVRPGITGWAQVNYPYGANLEDTRRKLEYDLYYIRHFSLQLDASIVLKTIHVMLFGKGR